MNRRRLDVKVPGSPKAGLAALLLRASRWWLWLVVAAVLMLIRRVLAPKTTSDSGASSDPLERQVLANIRKYGHHVWFVFDQDEQPDFSYSVGITKTTGAPEIVIYGLPKKVAHSVINEYYDQCRAGVRHEVDVRGTGLLGDGPHWLISVTRRHYAAHFGWCGWLYGGDTFEVVQLVWPDKRGRFVWDEGVSPQYVALQPLLR